MTTTIFRIGFSGTQRGMTKDQRTSLTRLLTDIKKEYDGTIIEFHHGACIGADEQAAMIAGNLGMRTVAHPGHIPDKRCSFVSHRVHDPMDNLTRNRMIAEIAQTLITTPATEKQVRRSGTWATIRYANGIGRFVTIIAPDGGFMHNG